MASFDKLIHKQNALECAQQHLRIQIDFESRLILIQWLDEEDCVKSMYIHI
jgi:hypothetical protein